MSLRPGAAALTFMLQRVTIHIPVPNPIFKTEPLSGAELALCLAVSSVVFFVVEIEKMWRRRAGRRAAQTAADAPA